MDARPILAACILLAGCAATLAGSSEGLAPAREPLKVELLDAWFVRVDGERVARDEFVYQSRVDCRAWAASNLAPPAVHLSWQEAVPQRVVQDLMQQLNLAGIGTVRIGF